LRAVEEGLPLFRAANTGISAAFDARGHELARLGLNQTGVVAAAVPAPLAAPLYARHGLVLPFWLGAVSLLLGLVARPWSHRPESSKT
jgi:apolipoprotein N-acyltransferase